MKSNKVRRLGRVIEARKEIGGKDSRNVFGGKITYSLAGEEQKHKRDAESWEANAEFEEE